MIAGVDIGGTKVAVGVVDRHGKVLASHESPTGSDCEYARGLDVIVSMLKDVIRNAGGRNLRRWYRFDRAGRSIYRRLWRN
jgi:predicted NBD/HSP70 family sugar kinase